MSNSLSSSNSSSGGDYDIEEGDFDEGPISLIIKPSATFEPSLSHSRRPRYEEEHLDSFDIDSGFIGKLSDKDDLIKIGDSSESHESNLDGNSQDSSVIAIPEDTRKSQNAESEPVDVVNKPSRKIPIVSKYTTNPDTYDLDYLLDPKIQKLTQAGHRFGGSGNPPQEQKQYSVNFLKKNKKDITKIRPKQEDTEHIVKLSELSPPRPIPVEEIQQRFYSHIDKVKEKVHKIAEELEQKNKEECTFKPQILTKRDSKRSVEDYVSQMHNYLETKNAKIKKLVEEKEKTELNRSIEDLTFQPSICANSAKMMESKRSGPIHERLFDISKQTDRSPTSRNESLNISGVTILVESRPFIPTVNKVSHEMVRNKSIDTLLYEDGLRRVKQHETQPPTRSPKEKLMSDRSEKVLIEKLQREFNETCEEIECGLEMINYTKFTEILFRTHFIKNDSESKYHSQEKQLTLKLWKELGGESEDTIRRETIKYALLGIMNYVIPIPDTHRSVNFDSKDSDVPEYLTKPQEGHTPEEVRKLHNRYMLLHETRVSKTHKSYLNRVYKETHKLPFKPNISQYKSLYTARNLTAENIKIEDHLIEQRTYIEKRKQNMKLELETKQNSICTFKPQISRLPKYRSIKSPEKVKDTLGSEYLEMMKKQNDKPRTDRLYELSKVAKEKKTKKEQEEKIKQEIKLKEECSFQPNLMANQNINTKKPYAQGIDKSIQRIRKAREASEHAKAGKEVKKDGGLRFDIDVKNQFKSSFDQLSQRDVSTSRSINDSRSVVNISKRTQLEERKKEVVTKLDRPRSTYTRHTHNVSKSKAARIQAKPASDSLGNSLDSHSFLTERDQKMHNLGQDVVIPNIDQSSIFLDSIDEQHIDMVSDLSAPAPLNIKTSKSNSRSSSSISSIDKKSSNQLVKTESIDDILDYDSTQDTHTPPIQHEISEDLYLKLPDSTPNNKKHSKTESYIEGELKLIDKSFETNLTIVLTDTETDSHDEGRSLESFSLNTSFEVSNDEESKSLESKLNQPIVLKVKLGPGIEIKVELKPTDNIESIIRLFIKKYNLKTHDASKFARLVHEALNKSVVNR